MFTNTALNRLVIILWSVFLVMITLFASVAWAFSAKSVFMLILIFGGIAMITMVWATGFAFLINKICVAYKQFRNKTAS